MFAAFVQVMGMQRFLATWARTRPIGIGGGRATGGFPAFRGTRRMADQLVDRAQRTLEPSTGNRIFIVMFLS
jgi:hypothetical protein